MERLHTAQAQALRQTMDEARKTFMAAQKRYHSALETDLELKGNPDGELALRSEGRACAQALTAYVNAMMAWLAYVDKAIDPEKAHGADAGR